MLLINKWWFKFFNNLILNLLFRQTYLRNNVFNWKNNNNLLLKLYLLSVKCFFASIKILLNKFNHVLDFIEFNFIYSYVYFLTLFFFFWKTMTTLQLCFFVYFLWNFKSFFLSNVKNFFSIILYLLLFLCIVFVGVVF